MKKFVLFVCLFSLSSVNNCQIFVPKKWDAFQIETMQKALCNPSKPDTCDCVTQKIQDKYPDSLDWYAVTISKDESKQIEYLKFLRDDIIKNCSVGVPLPAETATPSITSSVKPVEQKQAIDPQVRKKQIYDDFQKMLTEVKKTIPFEYLSASYDLDEAVRISNKQPFTGEIDWASNNRIDELKKKKDSLKPEFFNRAFTVEFSNNQRDYEHGKISKSEYNKLQMKSRVDLYLYLELEGYTTQSNLDLIYDSFVYYYELVNPEE